MGSPLGNNRTGTPEQAHRGTVFLEQSISPFGALAAMSHQATLAPGYRIERYLAEGGMGTIFFGKRIGAAGFEKPVVLKQLRGSLADRPEFMRLFLKEARVSAQLDHVNIVRTLDLARLEDELFIVMEYVDGADLKSILRRARLHRRPLSAHAALYIAQEVLQGLHYAQQRTSSPGARFGIVHRDISPANILCSREGEVKLSDFGIVKTPTEHTTFLQVRGKPGYIAPEQLERQHVDVRADLFSLAVCLFEALTGQRLFVADPIAPMRELYRAPPPSLARERPDLPLELSAVLARALQYDPEHRYQDAQEFLAALRSCADGHGLSFNSAAFARELRHIFGQDGAASTEPQAASTSTLIATGYEGKEVSSTQWQVGSGKVSAPPEPAMPPRPFPSWPPLWPGDFAAAESVPPIAAPRLVSHTIEERPQRTRPLGLLVLVALVLFQFEHVQILLVLLGEGIPHLIDSMLQSQVGSFARRLVAQFVNHLLVVMAQEGAPPANMWE